MFESSNPAFSTGAFADLREHVGDIAKERSRSTTMTIEGTALKTGALLVLAIAGAAWSWSVFVRGGDQGFSAVMPWMLGGLGVGLIFSFITIFKQNWAPVTGPIYAVAEGLALGGISALLESRYPGIPMLAAGLTFGVTAVMLGLYATRTIKVTGKLIGGIIAATMGVALLYFVNFMLSMFGIHLGLFHGSGLLSIGISLLVVAVAAFNLLLDFHVIEEAAEADAPKWMEWYGAFSIVLTLVWLYIELLMLLRQLRD